MRLLLLGNSSDQMDVAGDGSSVVGRLSVGLAERLHEPVEIVPATAYPSPSLAGHVQKQLDRVEPDAVLLHISGYTVGAASLEHGLRMRFGGRLHPVLRAGRRLARLVLSVRQRKLHANAAAPNVRLYELLRDALMRAGLAAPPVPLEVAIAAYGEAIALIAGREATPFAVRGPSWNGGNLWLPSLHARAVGRIRALDAAVERACTRRRVPYASFLAGMGAEPRRYMLPDLLHQNAAGHALMAELDLAMLEPLLA